MKLAYSKSVERQLNAYRQPKEQLFELLESVRLAEWESPRDAVQSRGGVENLGGGYLRFKILGNRFRLVARVNYQRQRFEILFFGTHADYERFRRRWRL